MQRKLVTAAFIEDYDTILVLDGGKRHTEISVLCGGEPVGISRLSQGEGELVIQTDKPLLIEQPIYVVLSGRRVAAVGKGIYDSPRFNEEYYYDGELGALTRGNETVFRVWAPLASFVRLNVFAYGEDNSAGDFIVAMRRTTRGVWEHVADRNLSGWYYTYTLSYAGAEDTETVDPYAVSTGINGKRGMILDMDSGQLCPNGWADEHTRFKSLHPLRSYTDAVIWETHVRDFSGKLSSSKHRRTFRAFLERGLTNSTGISAGLDHLIRMGITHVHLLPVAEYATVDQKRLQDAHYNAFNWGYDPRHFNAPMGGYCDDPSRGEEKVLQLREAVSALHECGIGVVFDVVYNHTYDLRAPLALTVPYYYYRFDRYGKPHDGSGCGNETASERPMCRKFIVDSLLHWQKCYHADGFRFDLMALHDIDTMREVERVLHAENPSALIYGEGWTGGNTPLPHTLQTNKRNAALIPASNGAAGGIAVFSDLMRDSVKGTVFHGGDGGYVNGRAYENVQKVRFASAAGLTERHGAEHTSASNLVHYVSAHDNNTLYDKLCMTSGGESAEQRIRMNRLAAAIIMTSRGVPFFQSGEEFLRSKPKAFGFEENSYNSPDSLNNLDWDSMTPSSPAYALSCYYSGLIALRRAHPALRIHTAEEVERATRFISDLRYDVIAYVLTACGETLLVVYNPLDEFSLCLPPGEWSLRTNGEIAGDEEISRHAARITIAAKSCYVLVRV